MSRQEIKEKAWRSMEMLLDKEMPHRKPILMVLLPYAATFALMISVTYIFVSNQNEVLNFVGNNNPIEIQPLDTPTTFTKNTQYQNDNHTKINNPVEETVIANHISTNTNEVALTETIETKTVQSTIIASTPTLDQASPIVNVQKEQIKNKKKGKVDQTKASTTENASQAKKFETNQKEQQVYLLTNEIKKSFNPIEEMGMTSSGSIGFVSENFDDYGIRLGFELQKPINNDLNVNAGVRYSVYKDDYSTTYQTNTPEELLNNSLIARMNERAVSRSFIELPVYLDYELTSNFKIKAGSALTYNKNNSESPGFSSQSIINNNHISESTKNEIGKLYADENGYLGEFLVGATLKVEKISFDVEATRGFINNQGIDNRNVVGMRISYKFSE